MKKFSTLRLIFVLIFQIGLGSSVWADTACRPHNPADTRIVDRGPIKTVVGSLAEFDPCHSSVHLDSPALWAPKHGEKPPLVIIAHGGGGSGSYERDFASLMNQNGFATLRFDAFEMNGLQPRTELLLYNMSNGGRQRMIFKATLGAFRWALKREDIDINRIFVQGLSNGGATAVNMAGLVDAPQIRGVVAEGAPSTGIGFPNDLTAPLLMIYGLSDNYGGVSADDFMYLRATPCHMSDHYPLAPKGFAEQCSRTTNRDQTSPSPKVWYEGVKARGQAIEFVLIEGGGHGMLFDSFRSTTRQLPRGRTFFASHGASVDIRQKLQKQIVDFMVNRLK